ncbi:MAG: hypothetical protein ACU836_09430 [Gammaproteobacteria bacterium]
MQYFSMIQGFLSLMGSKHIKEKALWDTAVPISLDEAKARSDGITSSERVGQSGPSQADAEEISFDELWQVFQSLEELEEHH